MLYFTSLHLYIKNLRSKIIRIYIKSNSIVEQTKMIQTLNIEEFLPFSVLFFLIELFEKKYLKRNFPNF